MNPDADGDNLGGQWFRDVNSKRVRFLVDGSGSMSACMAWSYKNNKELEMGDTERTYYTPKDDPLYKAGKNYRETKAICHETRMERLQSELTELIQRLPPDTKISLEAFSTSQGVNNKIWDRSANGLVNIKDNRNSALTFIDSLDDESPREWGGTDPWDGLQRSFNDNEADTLYFLSDGLPTKRLSIGGNNDIDASYENSYITAAPYFASKNDSRDKKLKVNTTSIKLQSNWMEALSEQTSGNYLQSQ